MSEISLRDYHKQLDNLLQNDQTDAVISHCRHILKHYPKNATTYRFLGRALLRQSRWEEAAEVFRRLLSTYPNDLIAHRSLSEIYHRLGKLDAALWHLERAFDHRPNDKGILSRMREYYQAYHGIALDHVQLTAGAAARQYIQSGLYSRAIETLRSALTNTPQRLDLKLLLAQALWLNRRRLEAAETAVEVLERMPFVVEANQLLTELWLNERRPSDAQRYLNRIEVVEPYLAYELATGRPADDHVVEIEELDYRKFAAAQASERQPDWLANIDEDLTDDVAGDSSWMEAIAPLDVPQKVTDDLSDLLPDDWESAADAQTGGRAVQTADSDDELFADLDLDSLPDAPPEPELTETPRMSTGLTGLLRALDEEDDTTWLKEAQTGSLDNIFEDGDIDFPDARKSKASAVEADTPTSGATGLTDLLQALDEEPEPAQPPAPIDPSDPMAWARNAGIPLDDDAPKEDFVPATDSDDPMAWLASAGIELNDGDSDAVADFSDLDDEAVAISASDVDPLAWARSAGIELEPDAELEPQDEDDDDTFVPPTDSLAWLGLDEAAETPIEAPPPRAAKPTAPPEEKATTDWLADDTLLDEMMAFEELATTPTGALDAPLDDGMTWDEEDQAILAQAADADDSDEALDEASLSWLAEDSAVEALDEVELQWESQDDAVEAPAIDLFGDMDDETDGEWTPETAAEATIDLFGDMDDETDGEWTPETAAEATIDLFGDMDDEADGEWTPETAAEATIDLFGDVDDEVDGEWTPETAAEATIDLFGDMDDEADGEWTPETAAEATIDLFGDMDDEAAQGFLVADDEDEDIFVPQEDPLAWAKAAGISFDDDEEGGTSGGQATMANVPDDWNKDDPESRFERDWSGEGRKGEMPSWLDELEEIEEAPTSSHSMLDRLGNINAEDDTVPDWLSEALPEDLIEEVPEEEDAFAWEEEAPSDLIAPAPATEEADDSGEDVPDWLSALSPMDEAMATDDESSDDQPAWLGDSGDFADAEEEIQWLSEDADLPEEDAFGEPKAEWLSEDEETIVWDDDEQPDDTPAWLSQAIAGEDDDEQPDDTPAWLSQAIVSEDDDEQPVREETIAWNDDEQPDDAPAWLSQAIASEDDDEQPDDTPAWLSQAIVSEDDDEQPDDAPAWLSQAIASEDDDEQPDDAPAWLSQAIASEDDDEQADYEELADFGLAWDADEEAAVADEMDATEAEYEAAADFGLAWDADEEAAVADEAEESLEWLDDAEEAATDEGYALPSATTGMTGLLSNIRSNRGEPAYLPPTEDPEAMSDEDEIMLDWLQDVGPEEPEAEEEPSTAVAHMPDWLGEVGAFDADEPLEEEPVPTWLSQELTEESDMEEEDTDQGLPAWMAEADLEEPDDWDASPEEGAIILAEDDTPDWLRAAEPLDEAEAIEESPAWSAEDTDAGFPDEAFVETAMDEEEDLLPIQEMRYTHPDEDGIEEETTPSPASNAPDWLNAMVPGLDIDYSAQEDKPIEREFVPEPLSSAQSAAEHDYAWLNKLVEEETAFAATLPPMPPAPPELPPAAPPERRRFVFSRPPVWLRRAQKPPAETSASASWLDDFDDE